MKKLVLIFMLILISSCASREKNVYVKHEKPVEGYSYSERDFLYTVGYGALIVTTNAMFDPRMWRYQ
ncbi:MAG: hypothetical protein LBR70_07270 [Lactobacillaceae bacterium]|jgi:hypothetical protein|nr:hypothetical protein [Lactobacillaceae bacterium]